MRFRWRWLAAVAAIGLAWLHFSRPDASRVLGAPATGPDFVRDGRRLSHPLRLIVYADTRFTDPKETEATNPKVRRWLVNKIAEEKPDALVLSGDLPWKGDVPGDYDVYRAETQVWRDAHLFIYPALGNHEFHGRESQCLENWWNAFPELRGRRWYSVQLGDSVYILLLDSNSSLLPASPQIEWIRAQLEHLPPRVRYVFVDLHHPPVVDVQPQFDPSHNGRPNERALAEFLARAPERSRVSFVVAAGHIHNYQRFYQDGIIYIVSGGGGAKPYPLVRHPVDLYQDTSFPNYHYVRFVEEGNKLVATMIRVADPEAATPSWEEKDHFEVQAATPTKAASADF